MQRLIIELIRKPWLAALFGGGAFCGFGYLGLIAWQDLQTFSAGPMRLSLDEAIARSKTSEIYAQVERVNLDCKHAWTDVLRSPSALVPIHDENENVIAVVDYNRHIDCFAEEQLPLVGVFAPLNSRKRASLVKSEVELSPEVIDICTNCGPENSRIGVIVCAVLGLAGLLLFPLVLLLRRRLQSSPAHRLFPLVFPGETKSISDFTAEVTSSRKENL